MSLIPLFVADRPVSLRILSGIGDYKNKFGILSHAFTTENFKVAFRDFSLAKYKIGDSGIYQGKEISYEKLFQEYSKMGVTHGIIKDYYRDPFTTLESAEAAIKQRNEQPESCKFSLIGVAQGSTVDEYLESYSEQRKMKFDIVAIGGLLTKIPNHARMVKVKREEFLSEVLREIRKKYPHDPLFPLGVFNRSRMGLFKELNIWASDYKGWIFKYDIEKSHRDKDRHIQTQNYIRHQLFPLIDKRKLLIMSCSKAKKEGVGKSIDIYDGPAFRVVRKYLKQSDSIEVRIISAKYGLIHQYEEIENYDEKISKDKAAQFRQRYQRELRTLFSSFDEVLFHGGPTYKLVLGNKEIECTSGRIGEQLKQLKNWLYR